MSQATATRSQVSPETVARVVGQPNVDTKAAQASGNEAKGSALAAVLIPILAADAQADEKRNTERFKVAVSLSALTPEGHKAFRAELRASLEAVREASKLTNSEARVKTMGLSEGSFAVYCSHWNTLSRAFEAGMPLTTEKNVACLLANARHMLAQAAAKGEGEAHNAKGAGRKAKSDYDKAMDAVGKLEHAAQEKLLKQLAASLGYDFE